MRVGVAPAPLSSADGDALADSRAVARAEHRAARHLLHHREHLHLLLIVAARAAAPPRARQIHFDGSTTSIASIPAISRAAPRSTDKVDPRGPIRAGGAVRPTHRRDDEAKDEGRGRAAADEPDLALVREQELAERPIGAGPSAS